MTNRFGIDIARDVRQYLAHDQAWNAAGELDDFDAAVHFGPCFGQRLAMFAGDERRELFEMLLEQRAEAKHQASPLDDRRLTPRRQRRRRRFHNLAGLLRRSERYAADHLAGRWVVDVAHIVWSQISVHLPLENIGTVSTEGAVVVAMDYSRRAVGWVESARPTVKF